MTGALQVWLRGQSIFARYAEGRMTRFRPNGKVMGHDSYDVIAVRGRFTIGRVEYSNQWGYYCFRPSPDTPFHREILAEIYAFLRARGGR